MCTTGSGNHTVKKWISEVSSTQPCINITNEKNHIIDIDDDKDSIEIDKEVETVLQSGTIVESLSITTENLNSVSSEAHNCRGELIIFTHYNMYFFSCHSKYLCDSYQ